MNHWFACYLKRFIRIIFLACLLLNNSQFQKDHDIEFWTLLFDEMRWNTLICSIWTLNEFLFMNTNTRPADKALISIQIFVSPATFHSISGYQLNRNILFPTPTINKNFVPSHVKKYITLGVAARFTKRSRQELIPSNKLVMCFINY